IAVEKPIRRGWVGNKRMGGCHAGFIATLLEESNARLVRRASGHPTETDQTKTSGAPFANRSSSPSPSQRPADHGLHFFQTCPRDLRGVHAPVLPIEQF